MDRESAIAALVGRMSEAWRLRQTLALAAKLVDQLIEPTLRRSPPHLSAARAPTSVMPADRPRPAQQLGLVW